MSEQDYIPGTTVIRNLIDRDGDHPFGTADQRYLEQVETFKVSRRLDELGQRPVEATFTFGHMRAIHRHLFQDVYAWAGEPRRVPMQKLGTSYAAPSEMNSLLRRQYESLGRRDNLRGIRDTREFAQQLAVIWGEINHGHAFREGNTRTQVVFFEQLAEHAGWSLDVARFSPHHPLSVYREFVDARFAHQAGRGLDGAQAPQAASQLADVLSRVISPDRSAQAALRRGVVLAASGRAASHLVRFPELRDLTPDAVPVGALLTGVSGSEHGAGDDQYQ